MGHFFFLTNVQTGLVDTHWHVTVSQHWQEVLVSVVFHQVSLTWLQRQTGRGRGGGRGGFTSVLMVQSTRTTVLLSEGAFVHFPHGSTSKPWMNIDGSLLSVFIENLLCRHVGIKMCEALEQNIQWGVLQDLIMLLQYETKPAVKLTVWFNHVRMPFPFFIETRVNTVISNILHLQKWSNISSRDNKNTWCDQTVDLPFFLKCDFESNKPTKNKHRILICRMFENYLALKRQSEIKK